MPGLEQLAAVIARHVEPGRGFSADPMSILILLAGRWAFGSANVFDSAVQSTNLWEMLRASAIRVGRELSLKPPTFSQLCHMRTAADVNLAADLAKEFTKVAMPLAKLVGLLSPKETAHWDSPSPSTVIYGDGSVVSPQSDVTVTVDESTSDDDTLA